MIPGKHFIKSGNSINMGPKNHFCSGTLSAFVARACLLALICLIPACGRQRDSTQAESAQNAERKVVVTVWSHHGKPEEWATIQRQVREFNESQNQVLVKLVEIAEASYNTQVQSAAASHALPDIMELDGPMLANYAWKGYLVPMGGLLSKNIFDDLLPSIIRQGTYAGHFYAVGTFDSGLGLYANRVMLQKVQARIPTGVKDAWTIDEFNQILARLSTQEKTLGGDGQVLDLKRDYRGEWWTYGFYPILVSAGADLINRSNYQSAESVLNSPQAIQALTDLRNWFKAGCVDPNTDGRAFVDKHVAISWVGHWEYPRYHQALGDDLLLLPLPNFGHGSRTSMGSWAWGVTRRCKYPEAAIKFIEFLLQPKQIEAMVAANGAVPSRKSVVEENALYKTGGPLHLYVEQLTQSAVPRPITPAYPVITSAFQSAILNIMEGGDVKIALNRAVQVIDQDIRDNDGYPPPK